ncbi:serine/threonine protein phosphatase [Kitasatospora sp. NPDC096128]|uniref:PP2C family protein-serine/threonine phosphatase n=1 Tax=Kitasatospora sp. NPDC096128 TaxID=3155547 RepID=UPI0033278146
MPRAHAATQRPGDRTYQCDAWVARHSTHGEHAYVILDGIGDNAATQRWTRRQAMRIAANCTALSEPTEALRIQRAAALAAKEWAEDDYADAVAVAALWNPALGCLEVGWCGDSRAYLLMDDGRMTPLTTDHNLRQALVTQGLEAHPDDRNSVTSSLAWHGDIGTTVLDLEGGRLLLASDGCYEPIDDSGRDLGQELARYRDPLDTANHLVNLAINLGYGRYRDNATCLVADLAQPRPTPC